MAKVEKIIHGDSLDVLKTMEDNSVDSVVTDPPYGLSKEPDIGEVLSKWLAGEEYDHGHGGFMGKTWDSFVPHPDIWREVYRVLKPGGHALVFAGTRTQDLMTISLRLAGFEVRDVIEWIYFSGFPKSLDVSKAFDKRVHSRDETLEVTAWIKGMRSKNGITNRQIDAAFGTNGMAGHWTTQGKLAQVPTLEKVPKLLSVLRVDEKDIPHDIRNLLIDKNTGRGKVSDNFAKREVVGTDTKARSTSGNSALPTLDGKTVYQSWDITSSSTDLAKRWDGWGTELKPAHEPIIVVRKPLDYGCTLVDNVEKHNTGAINIDKCRVPYEVGFDIDKAKRKYVGNNSGNESVTNNFGVTDIKLTNNGIEKGRFTANCITLDSDEFYSKYFNVASAQEAQPNVTPEELSKKASKKDRNSDWKGEEIALNESLTGHGNLQNSKGMERFKTYNRNHHPTVKPTDLMAWLVRLITPPNGVVLDPFVGSGSTLVAAKREGFGFIGVELTEEYIPIIEARVGVKHSKAVSGEGQATE